MRMHSAILFILAVLFLGSCSPPLESDWRRIDELDARLGNVNSLEQQNVYQPSPVDTGEASDPDGVSKVEGLLSLMSTGAPQDLTLAQVRGSTLANNLDIQSSLILPEIAAQQLRAEQAKFQWTLVASVEQSRVLLPEAGGGLVADEEVDEFSAVPGLDIPLRTGGTLTVDWTLTNEQLSTGNSAFEDAASQPSIQLQQPLLRDAGFDYNEASIVIAGANLGSSRAEAQGVVINQLIRAEIAYWNLHLAWKTLEIQLDLYRVNRNLLDEQRTKVAAGQGTIANVYNFEVSVAQVVGEVIEAELQLRETVRQVKVVMQEPGLTLDGSLALTPISKPRLVGLDFNTRRLVVLGLENRTDLLQLEFEQLSRTVDVMLKKNEVLPRVDLVSSWTGNGFDNGQSINAATRDLFDGGRPPGFTVGVNLSIPIGNEIALANYQAAMLQRLQTVANRRQQEILVTQDVLNAIDSLEAGWNSILTAEMEVRASQRFFKAYETLFNRGQLASINLIDALNVLNSSKIQKVSAEVDYQIDLAQLALATGCLLGHAGVDWEGDFDRDRLELPAEPPLIGIPAGESNSLGSGGSTLQEIVDSMGDSYGPGIGDGAEPSPDADPAPDSDSKKDAPPSTSDSPQQANTP
ncbi:MAG: hypothetical protein CBC35_00345 [Planctomycetes bacterium TMED75]|nr:hypothetical protein [Planctomycetaceae bacterium]OUU96900.1 MAG: hypothetical protein CBC35_00345 [Planctomycetes bacterium TMED75]